MIRIDICRFDSLELKIDLLIFHGRVKQSS